MVELLRARNLFSPAALKAIGEVERHAFVEQQYLRQAYADEALPIKAEQTISRPSTVAFQTTLLDPQPFDKILEIGTGSGYQAAVLSKISNEIFTIERHRELCQNAKRLFETLSYRNIHCFFGDGYQGLPQFAPFNKIIVTAGAQSIPEKLLEQLAIGGVMIIPVGDEKSQTMLRISRKNEQEFTREEFKQQSFAFVPLLSGTSL